MQVHWGQDCVTSYPHYPRWTTDRQARARLHYTHAQARTKTHTHTHTTVLSIHRHAGGIESRGTALRHSLNMQQAVLNKQENWMEEEEGVRGKTDWLGICEREGWRYSVSYCKVIEGGKKEGSEEKKRRQVYREALTDHRWLKDMWKGCSQNTALPSWTFYSAVSCSWCKRQRKRNTPVNSCLSLDSWEEWNIRLSVWRLRSVAKKGLHWQFGHGCSCGDGHTLLVKRFTDGNTSEGSPHQCEAKIQPLKVGNLYYHKIKSILSF